VTHGHRGGTSPGARARWCRPGSHHPSPGQAQATPSGKFQKRPSILFHVRSWVWVFPAASFTLDVANIFNEKQRLYQGVRGRTQDIIINFVTITAGVTGRF